MFEDEVHFTKRIVLRKRLQMEHFSSCTIVRIAMENNHKKMLYKAVHYTSLPADTYTRVYVCLLHMLLTEDNLCPYI